MEKTKLAAERLAIAGEIQALIGENLPWLKELWEKRKVGDIQMQKILRLLSKLGEFSAQLIKAAGRQAETPDDSSDDLTGEADWRASKLCYDFGGMPQDRVIPSLLEKFEELGFVFTLISRVVVDNRDHDIYAWADPFFQNDDVAMAVDIKHEPAVDDIKDFAERVEKLRLNAELLGEERVYQGAVAGEIFHENEKAYALQNGFYVIEPSGDTVSITVPEKPAAD
jgi:hypothetical protein